MTTSPGWGGHVGQVGVPGLEAQPVLDDHQVPVAGRCSSRRTASLAAAGGAHARAAGDGEVDSLVLAAPAHSRSRHPAGPRTGRKNSTGPPGARPSPLLPARRVTPRRRARMVAEPATPSAPRPGAALERRTAARGCGAKPPSIVPGRAPRRRSRNCSAATSQPRPARAQGPAAQPGPPTAAERPGGCAARRRRRRDSRWRRWKRRTARRVAGPGDAVHAAPVGAHALQRHLQRGGVRASRLRRGRGDQDGSERGRHECVSVAPHASGHRAPEPSKPTAGARKAAGG